MCTELININYSTFKSPSTLRSLEACLIEEDMLAFAGVPKGEMKKPQTTTKQHTRKTATNISSDFHVIPLNLI